MKRKLRYLSMLPVTVLAAVTVSVLASLVSLVLAAGNPVVVTMTDKPARYLPEKITVKVGTTVSSGIPRRGQDIIFTPASLTKRIEWSARYWLPNNGCQIAAHESP